MSNYICPSTDAARTELQALVDIVGDVPAYSAWQYNGGYPMDIAPNGEPSKLFRALLTKFNNDVVLATQEKVKMFSKSFRESFKGVYDDNHEPLIVVPSNVLDVNKDLVKNEVIESWMNNTSSVSDALHLIVGNDNTDDNTLKIARSFNSLLLDGSIANIPIDFVAGNTLVITRDNTYIPNIDGNGSTGSYVHNNNPDDYRSYGIRVSNDYVYLNDTTDGYKEFLRTLMHEIAHHYTVRNTIGVSSSLRGRLDNIYKAYKQVYPEDYASSSIIEFVAEVLSNVEVREHLQSMKDGQSMLDRIINQIKLFLNRWLKTKFDATIYSNVDDLIDDILNLIQEDIYSNPQLRVGILNNSYNSNIESFKQEFLRTTAKLTPIGERNIGHAKRLVDNLKQAIKNRIADTKRRTTDTDVPRRLRQLQTSLDGLDDIDALLSFVKYASSDIKKPLNFLSDVANGKRKMSYREVRQFRSDYIGFYTRLISDINELYDNGFFQLFDDGTQKGKDLLKFIDVQIPLLNRAIKQLDNVSKRIVELSFQKLLSDKGIEVNNPFIDEYIDKNTISTTDDIGWWELYVGSTANANDYALKTMWYILQNAKNEVKRNSVKAGKDILEASKGVGARDKLRLFERGSDGRRTGYIIRKLRYGEFKRDYYAFLADLKVEFGLDEDTEYPTTEEDFKAFNKRKNDWINKHANRRYLPEYYDLFANLSMNTTIAREEVQHRIDQILASAYDGKGDLDLMKLSTSQYDRLLLMYRRKLELANRYDMDGIEKYGTDLEIANELTKINEELEGKLLYKEQTEAYEAAKAEAKKRYANNPEMFNEWLHRNSRITYTQEFWDLLNKIDKRDYGQEYADLENERREVFKLYRNENDMNINESAMSDEAKQLIKYIDQRMNAIRNQSENEKTEGLKFKDVAQMVESPAYNHALFKAREEDQRRPGAFQEFLAREHYVGFKGKLVPYSYWMTIKPNNPNFIKEVPTRAWQEIDTNSPWYNKNYNPEDSEYMQPKDAKYDNTKEYEKVISNPKLAALRQKLIDSYSESNNKLLYRKNMDPHKLAQISGTLWQNIKAKGAIRGTGKYLADALTINNDDTDYGQTIQSPSGEKLYYIPTHFLKDLDDPELMTNDIVGATINYWEMSENYSKMGAVAPELELIKEQMGMRTVDKPGRKKGSIESTNNPGMDSYSYRKADTFLKMNLYGETKNRLEIPLNRLGIDKSLTLSKALTQLRNYGQVVNLGWNLTAMEVGFLTGLHHTIYQMIDGRYYQARDFAWGHTNVLRNMFHLIINWGNVRSNNKLLSLMEMNQISTTTDNMFDKLNYTRLGRFIMNHFWYGGYAGGDFMVKGAMLGAVYSNYRLYNNEFISKNDFMIKYFPDNKQDGAQAWKLLKTSLYDAYYSENGVAKVKPEYAQIITKRTIDKVNNAIRYLSAKADGVLTPLDKTVLHQNAWGQLFTMHRGWMFSVASNRILKKEGWNYQTGMMDIGEYRILGKVGAIVYHRIRNKLRGLQDIASTSSFKEELTTEEERALKLILSEIGLFGAYFMVAMLMSRAADDDEATWLDEHLAYMALRTAFEVRSQYNPIDVLNLIKSPTPIMGTINQHILWTSILIDIAYGKATGTPSNQIIESGAYKDPFLGIQFEKWSRTLAKMTPFKHLIEARDPNLKRKYLDNMIMR